MIPLGLKKLKLLANICSEPAKLPLKLDKIVVKIIVISGSMKLIAKEMRLKLKNVTITNGEIMTVTVPNVLN